MRDAGNYTGTARIGEGRDSHRHIDGRWGQCERMRQRKGERVVKVVQRSAGRPLLPGSTSCTALGFEAVKEGSRREASPGK